VQTIIAAATIQITTTILPLLKSEATIGVSTVFSGLNETFLLFSILIYLVWYSLISFATVFPSAVTYISEPLYRPGLEIYESLVRRTLQAA